MCEVGRAARDGCVIVNMQNVDKVKSIRGIMEDLGCLWLQVDMGGGGWEPCDAPAIVNNVYVAAGAIDIEAEPPSPPVVLPLRVVAEGFSVLRGGNDGDSNSDVEMWASPFGNRARRRSERVAKGSA